MADLGYIRGDVNWPDQWIATLLLYHDSQQLRQFVIIPMQNRPEMQYISGRFYDERFTPLSFSFSNLNTALPQ